MLTQCGFAPLSGGCVPVRTRHCSVRPQGEQYLIYNTRTDELHLISPVAAYVLDLCNGLNTLDDIANMFDTGNSNRAEVTAQLAVFLRELDQRGVLEMSPR